MFLQSEAILKMIEDARGLLEKAERITDIYVTLISYPSIREAFCKVAERARAELHIASPYISKESLKEVLDHVKNGVQVRIIVKRRDDYKKAKDVIKGKRGMEVRLGDKVHFKLLANEKEIIISSSNISKQGFELWREIGIMTNDPNIVNQARSLFLDLWYAKGRYRERYYGKKIAEIDTPTKMIFISSCGNLPNLIFDLVRRAKKVTIVSPYLTYGAVEKLIECINRDATVDAIIRIKKEDWIGRLSDPVAIERLLARCEEVWNCPELHAKVLIIDDKFAIISSLNVTDDGFKRNYEAGVLIQNPAVITALQRMIEDLKTERLDIERLREEYTRLIPSIKQREEPELESIQNEEIEVKKISAYPFHAGSELMLPKPSIPKREKASQRVSRVKEKATKPVRKKPKPIDLVMIELALIISTLLLDGKCKVDELLRVVEKEVAPKLVYFPWKLQGPRDLSGRNWDDAEVLDRCFKFLEKKGLYSIKLNRAGDTVSVHITHVDIIKEFVKKYRRFFPSERSLYLV